MKITNCTALTRGELTGNPKFSAFEDIKVSISQVSRGDLFIASCKEDIPAAIKKGAYGIMYDCELHANDDEIAWIRVRSVQSAALMIAKYLLLKKQINYVVSDKLTFDLAKSICTDTRATFLPPYDLATLFSTIKNDTKTFYISHDDVYMQELTSEGIDSFFVQREKDNNITSETMFETRLIETDREVTLKIPSFMMKHLRNAHKILLDYELSYDTSLAKSKLFFDPVFVDDSLKERDFGKTSKVVIFSEFESMPILKDCMDFVQEKGKWGKILFLLPSRLVGFEHDDDTIVTYFGSNEELLDILEDADFNFALLIDADRDIVSKDKKEQLKLF